MKKARGILWGIVLIAVGVIYGLQVLGVISGIVLFDGWWTLFIIVPCAIGLITDRDKTGSIIGICVGVILLLWRQDVIDTAMIWKLLVPAIVIIIGIRILITSIFSKKFADIPIAAANVKNSSGTAIFSGSDLNYSGKVFGGTTLTAVFGGVKCDLRGAVIENDCRIDATAIFGGIDILVPDNINVVLNTAAFMGGAEDKTARRQIAGAKTLYINAVCVFGGIDVK